MAIEILDHGACIAAGDLATSGEGSPSGVNARGIVSWADDGSGAVLLNLETPVGEDELIAIAQSSVAPMITQVDWVTDSQVRVTTRTDAGAASPGTAWFMFFRVPRTAVEA